MSLLAKHLEQIAFSFPPPKIFTNALLSTSDITSLIRDTEPHERALFSVPPPLPPSTAQNPDPQASSNRRQTVFNVASGEVVPSNGPSARAPRKNTAVAAVLGGELHSQIKKNEQGKGEFDIEVLLRGAEKLNDVHPTSGVSERIQSIRTRYAQLNTSLRHYEAKVARQTRELERMHRGVDADSEEEDGESMPGEDDREDHEMEIEVTDEDLRREEEEIRELERKKKALEDRVSGMERDLGGLLR
ncbi:hypothetical protein BP5796_07173 [Coleophoma crateriformis]|uniref:DASH complex subunit SPC34 n=1 Tax=Coleophoma crateriformis TaxID=565419 RepID=A0A3D8RIQ7_9HELO|nr:hypothetical protein BP5796_07173 [Coleophoma crateriformis]